MEDSSKSSATLGGIKVQGEKLLLIQDVLDWEKARKEAAAYKVKALGMINQFFLKPKAEDVSIVYEEKRYQAFWHIVGNSCFEYKRKVNYKVPVETVVMDVELYGDDYRVNKEDHSFDLPAVEHCKENYREEMMVDAHTDQVGDFTKYLKAHSRQIKSTEDLLKEGAMVVSLQTKASFLVRKVLNELVKPYKADEVVDEKIAIEELSLYFYPVYTFEYLWAAKDKRAVIEFDGVTGEIRKGKKITDRLVNSFTAGDLYDFAKEVANFFPGGSLAMWAGKKAYDIATQKK
ncbi:MAG TPA: hypothetical protein P5229_04070 [Candidatus Gracilibacteria bacterium]|nr:hypothetical protein [Candidatus Gracilibacteria bacterium]